MICHRVVDVRTDARSRQVADKSISLIGSNHIEVRDIVLVEGWGELKRQISEALRVSPRDLSALGVPELQARKLVEQDCRLHLIEATVAPVCRIGVVLA